MSIWGENESSGRRRVLSAMAGVAAGGAFAPWSRALDAFAASSPTACVVRPSQVAGPFYRDKRAERSDIRFDEATKATQPGAPLDLAFAVSRMDGKGCGPLPGAIVDVWNSGVDGRYLETGLRGYQVTDKDGFARFRTVFPGWYSGRTVHIHFRVRTEHGSAGQEFTSEMYFEDSFLDSVHSRPPYGSRGVREVRNMADAMYRAKGKDLTLAVKPKGEGYAGTFEIALAV